MLDNPIAVGVALYLVTLGVFLTGWKRLFDHIHTLEAAERRIRHEQGHEPVADDLGSAELSVSHVAGITQ